MGHAIHKLPFFFLLLQKTKEKNESIIGGSKDTFSKNEKSERVKSCQRSGARLQPQTSCLNALFFLFLFFFKKNEKKEKEAARNRRITDYPFLVSFEQ